MRLDVAWVLDGYQSISIAHSEFFTGGRSTEQLEVWYLVSAFSNAQLLSYASTP